MNKCESCVYKKYRIEHQIMHTFPFVTKGVKVIYCDKCHFSILKGEVIKCKHYEDIFER